MSEAQAVLLHFVTTRQHGNSGNSLPTLGMAESLAQSLGRERRFRLGTLSNTTPARVAFCRARESAAFFGIITWDKHSMPSCLQ